MSEKRIRELLQELAQEVKETPGIDGEVLGLVKQLETGVQDMIDPVLSTEDNTVLDDAIALEALFATNHPVMEKIIRELVNTLSKIGI
ncbi:MAG: DUF4404 family protein [Gammaproteobacteria bacterium]|nr:DUF4404 family protein [Gammaproteobacteria bacterium]MDP7455731.1 DUF4404 family protein [Gammaproteobacteria bacterium]